MELNLKLIVLIVGLCFLSVRIEAADCLALATNGDLLDCIHAGDRIVNHQAVPTDNVDGSFGSGFINGVSSVYQFEKKICLTENVTAGQLRRVVGVYLENHPERDNHSARSGVYEALTKAFPCK